MSDAAPRGSGTCALRRYGNQWQISRDNEGTQCLQPTLSFICFRTLTRSLTIGWDCARLPLCIKDFRHKGSASSSQGVRTAGIVQGCPCPYAGLGIKCKCIHLKRNFTHILASSCLSRAGTLSGFSRMCCCLLVFSVVSAWSFI